MSVSKPHFLFRPVYDIVFKMVFATRQDLLTSLLNAVLQPDEPITDVTVLNPEIPPDRHGLKGVVLDLLVTLNDDSRAIVEMQAIDRGNQPERSTFYMARVTSNAMLRGERYEAIPRVFGVFFLDYDQIQAPDGFHWTITYHIDQLGTRWASNSMIHVVELRKAFRATRAKWPREQNLLDWIQFLKIQSAKDVQKVKQMGGDVAKAARALEDIMNDPDARTVVDDHVSAMFDHYSSIRAHELRGEERGRELGERIGEERGRKIGEELGVAKGKQLAAVGMKRNGMSFEQIAQVLDVSVDVIREWLDESA